MSNPIISYSLFFSPVTNHPLFAPCTKTGSR